MGLVKAWTVKMVLMYCHLWHQAKNLVYKKPNNHCLELRRCRDCVPRNLTLSWITHLPSYFVANFVAYGLCNIQPVARLHPC